MALMPCEGQVRPIGYPLPWRGSGMVREAEYLGNQRAGLYDGSPWFHRHIQRPSWQVTHLCLLRAQLPSHWRRSFQTLPCPGCEEGSFIFLTLQAFMPHTSTHRPVSALCTASSERMHPWPLKLRVWSSLSGVRAGAPKAALGRGLALPVIYFPLQARPHIITPGAPAAASALCDVL